MSLSISKLLSALAEHVPFTHTPQSDQLSAAMLRGRGLSGSVQLTPREAQWVHAAADFVVNQAITHPSEGEQNFLVDFEKLFAYFTGTLDPANNFLTLQPEEKIVIGIAGPRAPHADAALRRYIGSACSEPTAEQWSVMEQAAKLLNRQFEDNGIPVELRLDSTYYTLEDFKLPKLPSEAYALPKVFLENCPGEPLGFGPTANVYYSDKLGNDGVDPAEVPYLPFVSILQNSDESSEPFTPVVKTWRQLLEATEQVNNGEYGEDGALTPPNDLPIWQTVLHAVCVGVPEGNVLSPSAMPEECARFGFNPKILANASELGPIEVAQAKLVYNLQFGTEAEQDIIDAAKQAVEIKLTDSALALKAAAQPQPPTANSVPAPAIAATPEPAVNGTHAGHNSTTAAVTSHTSVSSRASVWQPSRLLSGMVANVVTQAVSLPLRRLAAAQIGDPAKRKYAYALIDTISQGAQLAVLYGMDPQRIPGTAVQMAVSSGVAAFASVNVSHTLHAAGRAFGALNAVYAINQAIVKRDPQSLVHLVTGMLGNLVGTVAVEALMAKFIPLIALHDGADSRYREGFERNINASAAPDLAANRTLVSKAKQTCAGVFNGVLRLEAGFGNFLMDYLGGRKVGNLVAKSLQPHTVPLSGLSSELEMSTIKGNSTLPEVTSNKPAVLQTVY